MKASDCRARAANARQCAQDSPKPDDRAAWQAMERQWTALGDLAEAQERKAEDRAAG